MKPTDSKLSLWSEFHPGGWEYRCWGGIKEWTLPCAKHKSENSVCMPLSVWQTIVSCTGESGMLFCGSAFYSGRAKLINYTDTKT